MKKREQKEYLKIALIATILVLVGGFFVIFILFIMFSDLPQSVIITSTHTLPTTSYPISNSL